MKQEDFELVERCKRGEERAYAELLQRHQDSVYNICRRLTRDSDQARDLAQEAFIRTFSRLDRYDPDYPFSAWLFPITANLCIDFLRRRRLRSCSLDDPIESEEGRIPRQVEDQAQLPDRTCERTEMRRLVWDAVDQLPANYRLILVLRHQEDLSYEEIATTLDIPLGTVKARIHRARESLRALLPAYDPQVADSTTSATRHRATA